MKLSSLRQRSTAYLKDLMDYSEKLRESKKFPYTSNNCHLQVNKKKDESLRN